MRKRKQKGKKSKIPSEPAEDGQFCQEPREDGGVAPGQK